MYLLLVERQSNIVNILLWCYRLCKNCLF